MFGAAPAIGEYIKLNEQWFHVIGVVSPQLAAQTELAGIRTDAELNEIDAPIPQSATMLEVGK